MTPDPPDAAALIQRAERGAIKLDELAFARERLGERRFIVTPSTFREAAQLVRDLLALLTARETLQPEMIGDQKVADVAAHWFRKCGELEAKVTALEAALAIAQKENAAHVKAAMDGFFDHRHLLQRAEQAEAALATAQQVNGTLREQVAALVLRRDELTAERDALRDQVTQLRQAVQSHYSQTETPPKA